LTNHHRLAITPTCIRNTLAWREYKQFTLQTAKHSETVIFSWQLSDDMTSIMFMMDHHYLHHHYNSKDHGSSTDNFMPFIPVQSHVLQCYAD